MTLINYVKKSLENNSFNFVFGEVIEVNKTTQTCTIQPTDDGAIIYNCRLKAIEDEEKEGIIIFPRIGSIVIVAVLKPTNDSVVFSISSFDSCQIAIKDVLKIEIESTGDITFNGGEYGGIIKLPALKIEVEKVNTFLTTIKNVFTTWVPTMPDSVALKTAMQAALLQLQLPNLTNVGNDKIKH
jgi:hypothetical protein